MTDDEFRAKLRALGLVSKNYSSIEETPLMQDGEQVGVEQGPASELTAARPEEQQAELSLSSPAPKAEPVPMLAPDTTVPGVKIKGADRSIGEMSDSGNQYFPTPNALEGPQTGQEFDARLEQKKPALFQNPYAGLSAEEADRQIMASEMPTSGSISEPVDSRDFPVARSLPVDEERIGKGITASRDTNLEGPPTTDITPEQVPILTPPSSKDLSISQGNQTWPTTQQESTNPLENPELGDSALKDAQDRSRNMHLATAFGEGLGTFATKAAGQPFDRSFYENQTKQANQPIENIKERREAFIKNQQMVNYLLDSQMKKLTLKEAQDANKVDSNISKTAQALWLKYHPELSKDLILQSTAKELEQLGKIIEQEQRAEETKSRNRQTAAYNQARLDLAQQKLQQQKVKGPELSPFQKSAQQQEAKKYADVQSAATQADEQLILIDDAIDAFKDYSQKSIGGTGPIATLGGLTQYTSEKTQNLQAKFKLINVKNMAKTFQGMSRAIDSNTERRAWEATQASITNDDAVNANILLGSKALAIKAKAEAEAQRQFVENSPQGNLNGYRSPILGKTSVVVSPDGEMQLVSKEKYDETLKAGYLSLDSYAKKQILRLNHSKKSAQQVQTSPQQTVAVQKDPTIEQYAKQHNLNYERAEAILRRRQNSGQ